MNCPKCGNDQLNSCIDSRPKGSTIYRRRKCLDCGNRWSTFEISFDEYNELKEMEANLAAVQKHIAVISDLITERKAK